MIQFFPRLRQGCEKGMKVYIYGGGPDFYQLIA